ncbi:RimK family alpha-L-glutamate ligase [[Eubacterium] cellulosolvens]
MKVGLLTRNENAWCSNQLKKSFKKKGFEIFCFTFEDLVARIGLIPSASFQKLDLTNLDALLVRPIGRGSLEQIIFRLNLLQRLSRSNLKVINNPASIEKAADKYNTLSIMSEHGIRVPKTVVTENVREAMSAFTDFGSDAIIKPIFGSRGIGAARISDADVAERVFRTLKFNKQILYVQEYIEHGTSDIRAFVIGNEVAAAMRRQGKSWKTNVSKGAKPMPVKISSDLEEIAVKAARVIGCEIAGVDLLESDPPIILEINSQPGWRGLQLTTENLISDLIAEYISSF